MLSSMEEQSFLFLATKFGLIGLVFSPWVAIVHLSIVAILTGYMENASPFQLAVTIPAFALLACWTTVVVEAIWKFKGE